MSPRPLPRGAAPFDTSGIERDERDVAPYTGLRRRRWRGSGRVSRPTRTARRFAVVTEPLPRNPGGRILKRRLRENTARGGPVFGR